ncbi:MAG: hypothetical protein ACI9MR_002678 [Myxococcota bacterium]|jgi:hypothetical protein
MAIVGHVGAPFAALHEALVDVAVDWAALRDTPLSPELRQTALNAWGYRVQTEFRSVQVMTRFLTEVLGAGDPLEIYAGVVDAITDEVRHTALCVGVVEALGARAQLPDPVAETEEAGFLALGMPQRALGTAISMLAVSETISVALIEDLQRRCDHPTIRAVLDATLADEDTHQDFGWAYVRASLSRFDGAAHDYGRAVVETTLTPLLEPAKQRVAAMPAGKRSLEAWDEPELAALGLMSDSREALVTVDAYERLLHPRLRALDLLPPGSL